MGCCADFFMANSVSDLKTCSSHFWLMCRAKAAWSNTSGSNRFRDGLLSTVILKVSGRVPTLCSGLQLPYSRQSE
jgi:hypothetical protein